MSAILLLVSLSFLIWTYTGPCDWISRLDFDVPSVMSYPYVLPFQSNNETYLPFAVVGDTQRTSFWECTFGREVNDAETAAIVQAIAASSASFLVILGDLVFDGGDKRHWQFFDKTILPLRQKRLPILPVVGNHEYWGDRAAARKYVQERFPELRKRTWYSKQLGNLGLVWLNSNHAEMSISMWKNQLTWFKSVMDNWSSKESIKGILVFTHHPPYTNSITVSSDFKVRTELVDVFCNSPKAVALMAGHAHGYERFENVSEPKSCAKKRFYSHLNQDDIGNHDASSHSVQFIVSAGGGGPRPSTLRHDYEDAFSGDAPRPFNFILVEPSTASVKFSTFGLNKGEIKPQLQETISHSYLA